MTSMSMRTALCSGFAVAISLFASPAMACDAYVVKPLGAILVIR